MKVIDRQQCEGVVPAHVHARSGCGLVLSFSSRDLILREHHGDPPYVWLSLILRQAAMANATGSHRRRNPSFLLVWLKIYLIRLLPFPAAELTAQRYKNAHLPYPR